MESLLKKTVFVLTLSGAMAWWTFVLAHRLQIPNMRSVASVDGLAVPLWAVGVVIAWALIVLCAVARTPVLARGPALAVVIVATIVSAAASFSATHGHYAAIVGIASVVALVIGLQLGEGPFAGWGDVRFDARIAIVTWILVGAIASLFSMHRHWAFGSGSWDMGCMVHNAYRTSRFLDTISTVLGGVDFLGDHFMIGLYLFAPIFWIDVSGYSLLLIQSLSLASVAPVVYLIAKKSGASSGSALVLSLSAGLAFGIQSAAYFDSHEIAIGFGFLVWGVHAFEMRRLVLATMLLFAFALFKESLGLYVAALGILAIVRAWPGRDRRLAGFGGAWIAFGVIWFVLVNRFFMPILVARGALPEAHETFPDFGPDVLRAGLGVLAHPLKAFTALFIPEAKTASHLVTLGGMGFFAFLAPEVLIPALPLLAERFLSSKPTMWEMGYHYAAPLSFYAAWAVAIAWPRCVELVRRILEAVGPGLGARAGGVASCYVLASGLLVNSVGYKHPANFHRFREDYFAAPDDRASYARAVSLLEREGRDARIAAQNRLLPHLADRPAIFRLADWDKADFVLLALGESAWPLDEGLPQRLADDLARNQAWRLIFSAGRTLVFARRPAGAVDAPPASR